MVRRPRILRFDDKRTPLARLESLLREPSKDRSRRIIGRIREELERGRQVGPWIAAARTLAARGDISADAAYYFFEIFLECITANGARNDPEMLRLYDEIDKVKRAHGLTEDEDWLIADAPAEWLVLNAAWDRRDAELRAATLREVGQDDLADLLERDPDEFGRRVDAGHLDYWGARDGEG